MQNEKLSFKTELFFGRNWKFIFWGLVVAIIVIAWEINSINNQMKALEKVIYENNSKVVLTTIDGRAIKVEKTPLKAEYLKQYVTSIFVNNFVASRSQLTDNFQNSNIKEYKDILENSKSLGGIYLNFLDKENKTSVGQFISYIQWLISAVAQNKLPEYINIKDYTINSFEYNENTYTIDLSIKVASQSYILAQGKYRAENGFIRIKASGDFNLERSTEANPYGMYIKTFYIEPVTKGS
ncbi:hypothetical protein KDE13_09025 [Campylobacter sp. faydin G-140]|uniref:hypothetical protein n=1 Tax=Campylobacter anatolicus TaxID=2829105 RepID=UPI001B95FD7B|nr:hypothetical protein [Campylobacter anatolicus]MBR8466475.1 hypothetical protein [Campylobacter anatolicus]